MGGLTNHLKAAHCASLQRVGRRSSGRSRGVPRGDRLANEG